MDRARRPRRRLLVAVVLTAVLIASTTAIVAAQTGAVGTLASSTANAPAKPPALTGSSFWSGPTTDILNPAKSSLSLGETGPIPAGWWTITGQLKITADSADFGIYSCNLLASGATQVNGEEFSGGFTLAQLYNDSIGYGGIVTVPVRLLVNASFGIATLTANIQCRGVGTTFGIYNLEADLLVLPTKDGKIGV